MKLFNSFQTSNLKPQTSNLKPQTSNLKPQTLLLLLFSSMVLVLFCCDSEVATVNQEQNNAEAAKEELPVVKQVSYKKAPLKFTNLEKQYRLNLYMVDNNEAYTNKGTSKSNNAIIHTDVIKEITIDNYISYTMRFTLPNASSNKLYNLTIEDNNGIKGMFVTIYTFNKSNSMGKSASSTETMSVTTQRISSLDTYNPNEDTITENATNGTGGGSSSSSYTYPYNCDGEVVITYVLKETKCACDHTWDDLMNNICKGCNRGEPRFPSLSTVPLYECVLYNNGSIDNPDKNNLDYGGGSGVSSSSNTSSHTIMVEGSNVCQPTGSDVNGDCIVDNFEQLALTLTLSTEQLNWLYTSGNNFEQIVQFLNKQNYSREAKSFSKLSIEQMMQNKNLDVAESFASPFNVDLELVKPSETNPEPEKVLFVCIYNKLLKTEQFKELFTNVFRDNERLNVKFEFATDLESTKGASTKVESHIVSNGKVTGINQTIKLNKDWYGARSDIKIAQSILHECIHAYLNVKQIECEENTTLTQINAWELDDLINKIYTENKSCIFSNEPANQDDHHFMFNNLVPKMANILSQLKDNLISEQHQLQAESSTFDNPITNLSEPFVWNDFFKYQAMDGLNKTNVFKEKIENIELENTKYDYYSSTMAEGVTKNNCK